MQEVSRVSGIPVDGGELRYWRQKRVRSPRELAEASDVALSLVYGLENGYCQRVRPATIHKLADVLEAAPAKLVDTAKLR